MFTGIIEAVGIVRKISEKGSNKDFWLSADFTDELKIDQSLAHNGCCLTVVEKKDDQYLTFSALQIRQRDDQTFR